MNPAFQFETNRPGDIKVLAEFLKKEYPTGEIANEYFLEWEYSDNPSGPALVTLAKDQNGILAAQYAVIPLQIYIDGKIVRASLSLNTLTAGKFRGMGLFTQCAEANYEYCSVERIQFTIGVPNKNSFAGFTGKLGFTHTSNLKFLVKPLRPFRILKSFIRKSNEKKGEEIKLILNEDRLAQKSISVFNPDVDGHIYNAFLDKWKKGNSVFINRTLDYITWRYFKSPLRRYEVFKLVDKEELKAMIAIRTMNVFGMKACVVLDLLTTDEFCAHELLKVVSIVADENDLDIMIAATANKRSTYSIFRKSGFKLALEFLLPQQLPFIIRLHNEFENSDLLFNLDNWHFSFGDYDIF